ncbi:enamine deaminase RidA (YjgF/YER057c/UK114 family) [Chitinophaga skermanii]|uniref:Enamine deaminase RidA (YjgF/YER057c/UK114 family) n=1 Tax=Chitinophaga skermanii TaxID=331697 RepID=A0A327QD68_9BACT|nr:RidA family protein [Chitinophaga skermanii]RAJ02420.1 enamine deaminase RidA (YjgF/YER057c/UK114 family) [Chitinophaga skermanii]
MRKYHLLSFISMLLVTMFANAQTATSPVQFVNPAGVAKPNGYSQCAVIDMGNSKMLILSGQVPLNNKGELVGKDNFEQQAEQVFINIQKIVAAAGGKMQDVVKLSYFIRDTKDLKTLRAVRDRYINTQQPPASTLVQVNGLYRDDILLEIEATAVIAKQP